MKKINIVLYRPDTPRFNILMSYREVIESLRWGFSDLGYDCTVRENTIDHSALNIVFGWQVLIHIGQLDLLPKGSILYNLEQFCDYTVDEYEYVLGLLNDFIIWDYSEANLAWWRAIGISNTCYAKISYSPSLSRLPSVNRDIDFLFYGSLGSMRLKALQAIQKYRSIVFLGNVWGEQRDSFIARSKIILNPQENNPKKPIFEIVRVSYLLANKKAVLCQLPANFDLHIEADMKTSLIFDNAENLSLIADFLLESPSELEAYAEYCYSVFEKRDVREVIKENL
jgi:hypothetical protein